MTSSETLDVATYKPKLRKDKQINQFDTASLIQIVVKLNDKLTPFFPSSVGTVGQLRIVIELYSIN